MMSSRGRSQLGGGSQSTYETFKLFWRNIAEVGRTRGLLPAVNMPMLIMADLTRGLAVQTWNRGVRWKA